MESSDEDDLDRLQMEVEAHLQNQSRELLETSFPSEKDERLLPVHFLPEGRRCYDWISKDLEKISDNDGKTVPSCSNSQMLTQGSAGHSSNTMSFGTEEGINGICNCSNCSTYDFLKNFKLLASGSPVNWKFTFNSITRGKCSICSKIKVDERDVGGTLLIAAENGEMELMHLILTHFPRLVNAKDEDGYTPLHRASYNGHLAIVSCLLKEFSANVSSKTEDGWQPLHSACRWNQLLVAEELIQHGANINAQTNGGLCPLHLAATSSDRLELLEMLLLNDSIDTTLINGSGETAYSIASRNGLHYKLFELVEESLKICN